MSWVKLASARNYLRVRGEYPCDGKTFPMIFETTSACAENTFFGRIGSFILRNYLRVRGEYEAVNRDFIRHKKLPPRARRIHMDTPKQHDSYETTSACAENTGREKVAYKVDGNYLRVRGEYMRAIFWGRRRLKLPPHVRRILDVFTFAHGVIETTSACAENTLNELGLL